jgi:hypothetical protein
MSAGIFDKLENLQVSTDSINEVLKSNYSSTFSHIKGTQALHNLRAILHYGSHDHDIVMILVSQRPYHGKLKLNSV